MDISMDIPLPERHGTVEPPLRDRAHVKNASILRFFKMVSVDDSREKFRYIATHQP